MYIMRMYITRVLTRLRCAHGHGHVVSYDLTPCHGDQCPHRVGDGNVGEHDDTNETRARQWFAADGRRRGVDACKLIC